MSVRNAIVLNAGQLEQLQSGDTISGLHTDVAVFDASNQSAAITATTLLTTPAVDGMYMISWVAYITQAATTSSTLGNISYTFTGADDNVAKSGPPGNTVNITGSTANTTGTVISGSYIVHAKASTAIQFAFQYASSGATPMKFSIHIIVSKL